ncbi:MAG: head decoration protein [bacterium]
MSGTLGTVSTDLTELSQLYGDSGPHPMVSESISGADLDRGTILARDASDGKFKQLVKETAVEDESVGAGDDNTETFTETLAHSPVIPRTVTVAAGAVSGTDNGFGTISGTGITGTIDYNTGELSVTFAQAPAGGTAITADYSYGDADELHIPRGILAEDADAALADVSALVCKAGVYRDANLTWPSSITAANKARAKLAMADKGIYLI